MFGRRADATLAREISTMRRFMPYISPRRNESLFYMMQEIEVDAALEFLEKRNRERPPDRPITLFQLFLRSCAQTLHLRPGVNRFVKGGKLWQRNGDFFTFSAKQELVDGAPLITVKRESRPDESFDAMVDSIYDKLRTGRSGKKSTSDKEMGLLLRAPGVVVKAALALHQLADRFGLLPRSMIDPDPLYTSCFIANLGSIDYPAGFHHLWEYGTASLFGVLGRIEEGANGRRKVSVAWTYDERIADGLYSYHTLQMIKAGVEQPELLEQTALDRAEREGRGPVAR